MRGAATSTLELAATSMSNAGIEPIFQDMLEAAAPTVVVASFRRSGTHLTIDSLINNASDVHSAYLNLETLNPAHKEHVSDAAFVEQLNRERRKSVIVKTHFGPSLKSNGSMWLRSSREAACFMSCAILAT